MFTNRVFSLVYLFALTVLSGCIHFPNGPWENFGELKLYTKKTKTIDVLNGRSYDVSIDEIVSTLKYSSVESRCPKILKPQERCQILVTFSAKAPGKYEGTLGVTASSANNGGGTVRLHLTASASKDLAPIVAPLIRYPLSKMGVLKGKIEASDEDRKLHYAITEKPAYGEVILSQSGYFLYRGKLDRGEKDSFKVQVVDRRGNQSFSLVQIYGGKIAPMPKTDTQLGCELVGGTHVEGTLDCACGGVSSGFNLFMMDCKDGVAEQCQVDDSERGAPCLLNSIIF